MPSITMDESEDIFINGLRNQLSDSNVLDINDDATGTRASKSYWIDKGWSTDPSSGLEGQSRWATWGLPQVQMFTIQSVKDGEGKEGEQYWNATLQLDIFAKDEDEKKRLAGQARDMFKKKPRKSLSASGLMIDSIINDFDSIADERLPQGVYRRTLTYRVFYRTDRG